MHRNRDTALWPRTLYDTDNAFGNRSLVVRFIDFTVQQRHTARRWFLFPTKE